MNGIRILVESIDIVGLFQRVLVPVLMISGIGLFILVIQTRYGRIVDRIRIINSERRDLIKKAIMGKESKIEKTWSNYRLQNLQEQMSILIVRGKLLKDSLKFMFIVIFTSIISSLLLFVEQIIKTQLSFVVLILLAFGMVMLFMACLNVIREIISSYSAVIFDVDTHVPRRYRVKDEKGILKMEKKKKK